MFAHAVIEKVTTREAIALFGSRAASSAEKVAAFARFRSETTPLVTLRTAIDFGEFLAIFWPLAPATGLARFVTRRTISFGFSEIVNPNVFRCGTGDNLFPVDCLHVAEVVVVEESTAAGQNVPQGGHLQVVHFRQGDDEGEFLVVYTQFEQSSTANNLQRRKDDAFDIDVRDEHVARHFANVLQEAQIEMFILEPSQFQIAIDVSAIGVAISQVSVMVFPIRRH